MPPAVQADPAPDPGAKNLDAPGHDQAKTARPAVMNMERFGVVTVGAAAPITHGLTSLHPPGVGLDLFFDRHDFEGAWFVGGVPRKA